VADFPQVIRLLDKHFGISTYSLKSLFRDEQRQVLDRILGSTLAEVEAALRQIYEEHYPLMRSLTDLGNPTPKAFRAAAAFILNTDLRWEVSSDTLNVERIRSLLEAARMWSADLDAEGLSYLFEHTLERTMANFVSTPEDLSLLRNLVAGVTLARSMPYPVNLWRVQHLFYEMRWTKYPGFRRRVQKGDDVAGEWVALFLTLGDKLLVRVA
jgi:hypothetical protein